MKESSENQNGKRSNQESNWNVAVASTSAPLPISSTSTSTPAPPKRPKRTHAKRSCLQCRTSKTRCELPDITVESSMEPLEYSLKCHRCSVLHHTCIVYDGDRKQSQGGNRYKGPTTKGTSQEPQPQHFTSNHSMPMPSTAPISNTSQVDHLTPGGASTSSAQAEEAASLLSFWSDEKEPVQTPPDDPSDPDSVRVALRLLAGQTLPQFSVLIQRHPYYPERSKRVKEGASTSGLVPPWNTFNSNLHVIQLWHPFLQYETFSGSNLLDLVVQHVCSSGKSSLYPQIANLAAQHLISQEEDSDIKIAQALLVLAQMDPLDLSYPSTLPSHSTTRKPPGRGLILASKNIANSLHLDKISGNGMPAEEFLSKTSLWFSIFVAHARCVLSSGNNFDARAESIPQEFQISDFEEVSKHHYSKNGAFHSANVALAYRVRYFILLYGVWELLGSLDLTNGDRLEDAKQIVENHDAKLATLSARRWREVDFNNYDPDIEAMNKFIDFESADTMSSFSTRILNVFVQSQTNQSISAKVVFNILIGLPPRTAQNVSEIAELSLSHTKTLLSIASVWGSKRGFLHSPTIFLCSGLLGCVKAIVERHAAELFGSRPMFGRVDLSLCLVNGANNALMNSGLDSSGLLDLTLNLTTNLAAALEMIEQKARRADRPNRPSDPPPNNFSETPGSRDLSTPAQQPGFPSFNQPSPFDPNVQYQANLAPVYPTSNYASTSQNHQYGPPLFPNVPNDFQAFSWTAEDLLKSALDVDLNFLFGPTP